MKSYQSIFAAIAASAAVFTTVAFAHADDKHSAGVAPDAALKVIKAGNVRFGLYAEFRAHLTHTGPIAKVGNTTELSPDLFLRS